MKRGTVAIAVLLLVGLVGGCADKYETNEKEHLELLKELNKVLATAKDKDSLQAAIPLLAALNERIRVNIQERDAMTDPSKKRADKLRDEYSDRLKQESEILGAHMREIDEIDKGDKTLRKQRQDAMKDIPPDY